MAHRSRRPSPSSRPRQRTMMSYTPSLPFLLLLLALFLAASSLPCAQAVTVPAANHEDDDDGPIRRAANAADLARWRALHQLARRSSSDGSPNTTLAETARMGLMSAQRAAWEQGVAQSALLEYDAGPWSVFAGSGSGPPYRPDYLDTSGDGAPMPVMSMAYHSVSAQDSVGRLGSRITGDEDPYGGAAADSASCGEGVLLASFNSGEVNSTGFWQDAVQRQMDYLMQRVPICPNGAISHRASQKQLWSDAVYMFPPFMAAYGLFQSNQSMLQMAYDQIRLYREGLLFTSGPGQGMWGHILAYDSNSQASWTDGSAWATGQGWVTAGILKTLASIAQSPYSSRMASQKADLVNWAEEVLNAAYPFLSNSSYLFHNHVNDTSTFQDTAGSALIAYSTFRLAAINANSTTSSSKNAAQLARVNLAEQTYQSIQNKLNDIGAFSTPVVNALSFSSPGDTSAEALAFVLLLEAARRDYYTGNVTGIDGPGSGGGKVSSSDVSSSSDAASSAVQRRRAPGPRSASVAVVGAATCLAAACLV